VEQVTGLTDADVGGMSHGVQDLVTNDKALVRVTVTVSSGDSATTYDATRLRAFQVGSSVGTAPVGSSLPKGRLGAHARIEGSLSYVVPRNGAQLVLRADNAPHEVPLLQVDTAVPGAGDHLHAPSGASGNGAPPPSKP
jgi:hypothetical protein